MAGFAVMAIAFITFTMSCSKSSNNNNTNVFPGTYYGTITVGSYTEGDTIVIPASTTSSVVLNSKTAMGSSYAINGTANGSALTIPSQSVYIASLNGTYTVVGTGNLSNSTLTLSWTFTSAANVTTNSSFTGTKK